MTRANAFILVFLTIFFTVFGQLVVKFKAGQMGALPALWADRFEYFRELFLSPWVISGVASGGLAAICWILAMTRLPISVAYPFMALTFPLVVVVSHYLFDEHLSVSKVAGVLLIMLGVSLVNQSAT